MRSSRGRPTGLAEQFCADDNKKKGAETRPRKENHHTLETVAQRELHHSR
jgi:hypothetical protein